MNIIYHKIYTKVLKLELKYIFSDAKLDCFFVSMLYKVAFVTSSQWQP